MATAQQKARLVRLWIHESKPIITVQISFGVESWYEQFRKGAGRPLVSNEAVEQ
ncbi:hypothetical protein AVEN_258156-1, partial [Araneus ventricosus]